MNIEEVRGSFTVYIIASELNRLDGISESLGLAGYMCVSFTELTAAISEFSSNPPHMVLLDGEESRFDVGKAVIQIAGQLPESHMFLVSPLEHRDRNLPYLDHGVYDLIYTPVKSTTELLKKLDRAAERDYFMYLNERLMAERAPDSDRTVVTAAAPHGMTESELVHLDDARFEHTRKLIVQPTADTCINTFLRSGSEVMGGCGALFFKYIPNRRVLVATHGYNVDDFEWSGVGVDFNEVGRGFRAAHLREPSSIAEFEGMLREVFNVSDFFVLPVEILGEIHGVVAFLAHETDHQATLIQDLLMIVNRTLSLHEAERRLHVATIKDPATDLLNRQNFLARLNQEIARSRRTMTPLSLVLLTVDQYGAISTDAGNEEALTLLRMAARIVEKNSRINDILGRTGTDEFGLLLPHTGRTGAMVKAERLRRIMESADFSRVLKTFPRLTVSMGIAEYPSMVRDAEELLQAADLALAQVRAQGNRTCVAKPPEGFVADFQVPDKEL